jgi:hypothetical protein
MTQGISFGMSAGLAAHGLGMGTAGVVRSAVAGGVLGMGVGAIGSHIFGNMMEGAQEQSQLERTLGQFRFQNPSGFQGQGFSRMDTAAIGNMVRHMERMPEMLTSFGELNQLMDKMGQMGLMQGLKTVGDFTGKFQKMVTTLRDMAKMMGTTMEGALQSFSESRLSGFYTDQEIRGNQILKQVTASVTGMTQEQVSRLQQFGGEVSHSRGGSRQIGARAITRTANQLGMANQLGILSNSQIVEMTGKEGAEGLQDMAVSLNNLGYKMARSGVGTAMTLAMGEVVDGRYTGAMDQELLERFRSGGLSKGELLQIAHQKANTREAKLSFVAKRARLTANMVGEAGPEMIASQLQHLLGERGWHNEDAMNLVMQRFGATEEEATLLQQVMPNLKTVGLELSSQRRMAAEQAARNQALGENSWEAVKKKISTKLSHITGVDFAKDLGVAVRDYIGDWAEDFVDTMTGSYKVEVTKRGSRLFNDASRGDASALSYLSAVGKRTHTDATTIYDSSKYGLDTDILKGIGVVDPNQRSLDERKALFGGRFMSLTAEGYSGPMAMTDENVAMLEDRGKWDRRANAAFAVAAGFATGNPVGLGIGIGVGAGMLSGHGDYKVVVTEQDVADQVSYLNSLDANKKSLASRLEASVGPEGVADLKKRLYEASFDEDLKNLSPEGQAKYLVDRLSGSSEGSLVQTAANVFGSPTKALWEKATGGDPSKAIEVLTALAPENNRYMPGAKELSKSYSGSLASYDWQELARSTKALDTQLGHSLKGEKGAASWAQIKDLINEDTGIGRAIEKSLDPASSDIFESILSQRGEFNQAQVDFLKKNGMTDEDIKKFNEDKSGLRNKLHSAIPGMTKEVREAMQGYLQFTAATATKENISKLQGHGAELASGGTGSNVATNLSKTTKGKSAAFSEALSQMGKTYKSATLSNLSDSRLALQAAGEAYAEMDERSRGATMSAYKDIAPDVLRLGEENVRLKGVSKTLKGTDRRGKKRTLSFDEAVGDSLGLAGSDLYKEGQALDVNKDNRIDADEMANISKLIKDKGVHSHLSTPGSKAGAAGVSEESVKSLFNQLNAQAITASSALNIVFEKLKTIS